ncbi:hypothetical protein PG994_002417 [Apiospora phragmitis]|uniref:Uncharacterized protein n=1 Tax=Apiospora phragmitis TaxID=2905665 RepID=A0ABR1WWB2_9PEZI
MKYSIIPLVTLLAGYAAARSLGKRGSNTLHGAMSDVLDATRTLDHVVGGYDGGEAEDIECAINTAVVVLRQAIDLSNGLAAPLTSDDAQSFQASAESLGHAGDTLVKSFGDKIPIFNEARICNSITAHVTDLGEWLPSLAGPLVVHFFQTYDFDAEM